MYPSSSLLLLFFTALVGVAVCLTDVHLLALVPWPDDRDHADWDAGPDLLASARVAIDEVNNSTMILPDYRLVLNESGHEACGLLSGDMGILNMIKYAVNPHTSVQPAAVLGLFCSTSTKVVAPLAGRYDMIQLSGSNSPEFLFNKGKYPHLWRFLESGSVHADTMVGIMDNFEWKNAALIVDFENSFASGIGDKFIEILTETRSDLDLLYQGNILKLTNINDTIKGIREARARIIFLAVTAPQAARIFCTAAKMKMYWPNYVWVLADYYSSVIYDEVNSTNICSDEEFYQAINNSLITYFRLKPLNTSTTLLVSNKTYDTYEEKYNDKLAEVRQDYIDITDKIPGESLYGGIIYDQVWAFALMLESALPDLAAINYSISNYTFGQPHITEILEDHLKRIDFMGATGRIKFTENYEVSNTIEILQVKVNKTDDDKYTTIDLLVGEFNGTNSIVNIANPPDDEIEDRPDRLPLAVAIVSILLSVAALLLVTINLTLIFALRKKNESVHALSPNLSILIFVGCYFECIASLMLITQNAWEFPEVLFTIFCSLEMWVGLMGLYLILATNLFKIARIFRIFTYFGKTSRYWSDWYLFLYVLIVCALPCVVFVIWIPVDRLEYETKDIYHDEVDSVYIERKAFCHCEYYGVWFGILYCYVGLLIFALLFFAIQTRKVNRRSFKDTKKVNAFIFFTMIIFCSMFATERILADVLEYYTYANLTLALMFLSICFICQLFLFVPKIFLALRMSSQSVAISASNTAATRRASNMEFEEGRTSPHTFTRSLRSASRSGTLILKQASNLKIFSDS
jgi:gamma-aminobutyric acid type B receptor